MTARAQILARIRARTATLAAATRSPQAARMNELHDAPGDADRTLAERFAARARLDASDVQELQSLRSAPAAVAAYLSARQLDPRVALAADVVEHGYDWAGAGLETVVVAAPFDAPTTVTGCFAGLADCGAVACTFTGSREPAAIYRAATHVVLLERSRILRSTSDLWPRLSSAFGNDWPASVNLVAGPSRTADIELELQLGVHGPLRVLILIGDGGSQPEDSATSAVQRSR